MRMPRKAQVAAVLLFVGASVLGLVSTGTGQPTGGSQSRRLALLIGVDKYRDPNIRPLSGCGNDIANWEDVLMKRYGFAATDIVKLVDEKATKAAVKDAFAKHLVARATADTVVFIALSSHGTQVLDRNGDEAADGLDETFVLHDTKINESESASHLVDDEVNQLIADLNKKTQHVVLIADSCHSGTVTRAAGPARSIPVSERVRQQAAELVAKSRSFADDETESIKPPQGGPRYVLFSASKSNETAHEKLFDGKTNGAFTWFMTAALRKANDDATYKDIFEKVRFDVTTAFPAQHPEIEGAEQETGLFGLKPVKGEAYLAVESAQGNKLTLAGGQVHGIGVGSRFGIFAPGTKTSKGATPLATAEVKSVALTTSQAELTPAAKDPGRGPRIPHDVRGADPPHQGLRPHDTRTADEDPAGTKEQSRRGAARQRQGL